MPDRVRRRRTACDRSGEMMRSGKIPQRSAPPPDHRMHGLSATERVRDRVCMPYNVARTCKRDLCVRQTASRPPCPQRAARIVDSGKTQRRKRSRRLFRIRHAVVGELSGGRQAGHGTQFRAFSRRGRSEYRFCPCGTVLFPLRRSCEAPELLFRRRSADEDQRRDNLIRMGVRDRDTRRTAA